MNVNVVGHRITTDEILKYFEIIEKVVSVAEFIARLTPTAVDNEVLDKVRQAVAFAKPLAGEQWFEELVNIIVHLFVKHESPRAAAEELKKALGVFA